MERTRARRKTDKWVMGSTIVAFLCMVVTMTVGYTTQHNRSQLIRVEQVTDRINAERERNIRSGCEDVNQRYDAVVAVTRSLTAARLARLAGDPEPRPPVSEREYVRALRRARSARPAEAAQMDLGRRTTVVLISALVPKRDCERLVRSQIRTARP